MIHPYFSSLSAVTLLYNMQSKACVSDMVRERIESRPTPLTNAFLALQLRAQLDGTTTPCLPLAIGSPPAPSRLQNVRPHSPRDPRLPCTRPLRLHRRQSPRQRPRRTRRQAQRLRDQRHAHIVRGLVRQSAARRCRGCGAHEGAAIAELQGHLEPESAAEGGCYERAEV
jgi:hypothetical protein